MDLQLSYLTIVLIVTSKVACANIAGTCEHINKYFFNKLESPNMDGVQ